MNEPKWIRRATILKLHAASLAEHGGKPGIRDQAGLDSALARPRNLNLYRPEVDVAALSASYCFGLTRNHPFNDGNKRASFHAAELFLLLNGYDLIVEDETVAVGVVFSLAAGEVGEDGFAAWIRERLKKRKK